MLGPVVPAVYKKYKVCGKSPILNADDDYDCTIFDSEEIKTLLDVMLKYGQFTGTYLVNLTHNPQTPWSIATEKNEKIISKAALEKFFSIDKNAVKPFRVSENTEKVNILPNSWYNADEDNEWGAYL